MLCNTWLVGLKCQKRQSSTHYPQLTRTICARIYFYTFLKFDVGCILIVINDQSMIDKEIQFFSNKDFWVFRFR